MTNKQLIERRVKAIGYSLGCYNKEVDKIPKDELIKVLDNISEEATDIEVTINSKKYIVEVKTVDQEKDFDILSKDEYISRYGEPEED